MKFAHLADCHLGCWNAHPELESVPNDIFDKAMSICIDEGIDFILISGDLFHSSLPSVDTLTRAVASLRKVREGGIRVYVIAGSHDFSPSGKTMLNVLEKAGLLTDVSSKKMFVEDESGAIITGIAGRVGSLEIEEYKTIPRPGVNDNMFKIFMFHTAITEFKPGHLKEMPSLPLSLLPKGFDYYAGGHVHQRFWRENPKNNIVYPGSLFPCNFVELEKNESGGFYIVEAKNKTINLRWLEMKEYDVLSIVIDANGKSALEVEKDIMNKIEEYDTNNKIVLIRVHGTLDSGKPSDIDFKAITERAKGAKAIKRNFNKLQSKEFEEIPDMSSCSIGIEELERELIHKHLGQIKIGLSNEKEERLTHELMNVLQAEKIEGETNEQFRNRIIKDAMKVLNL